MRRGRVCVSVILTGLAGPTSAGAQVFETQATVKIERPIPGPVVPPRFFRQALERGTRTEDGRPGPEYWQNHAVYDIEASLDPETGILEGRETIRYFNRAPGDVRFVVLNLYQNIHQVGAVRYEAQEVTGGVALSRVVVDGVELPEGNPQARPAWVADGTVLAIRPPEPVPDDGEVELELEWTVTLPQNGAGRMGHSDREIYFVAYWFPKVAVLDDLLGWDFESYRGNAEFYDGYGDYDVSLTVPTGWTVMATGELENADEVFSTQTNARLEVAAGADTVVHVATRIDRRDRTVTATGSESLTYRFTASNVRDFTWTTSDVQVWDATSAVVADRDGDGAEDRVKIHSFWRDARAPLWADQARYGKHAIEHHSRFTGLVYPWPHMTSVEGDDIVSGGMEFPMLTLIGDYNGVGAEALYGVTSHELGHMWIPMIVGTNERRYAWMDEGSTTFLENSGRPEFWPESNADSLEAVSYLRIARLEGEQDMMRHGDYYVPGPGYSTASYSKPATLLVTLKNLLGEEVFMEAYRSFIQDWSFKHPSPWDFFNTFERVAGQDLDWFWSSWYFETWRLDHAVGEVREGSEGSVVVIKDRGFAPMPALVRIRTSRGGVIEQEVPVDVWLSGETDFEIVIPESMGAVVRVDIDPEMFFPDVDRTNNTWRGDP